jgi:hypothetical protein
MADSSSDDEELNTVKKHLEDDTGEEPATLDPSAAPALAPLPLPLPIVDGVEVVKKKPGRKRKSLPMLEDGENPMAGLPLPGKKYKENNHFPWLELSGT